MKNPNWRVWIKNKNECRTWLGSYLKKGILKRSLDESTLHLQKANHNLNLANWLIEKHKGEIPKIFEKETFYDWAISIYYYAVYHAALALISREGYNSKNHSAALCFLIYHHYHMQNALNEEDVELIADSINKEDVETIGSLKELREKASYDIHEIFEKKIVEHVSNQAISFIKKIRLILLR